MFLSVFTRRPVLSSPPWSFCALGNYVVDTMALTRSSKSQSGWNFACEMYGTVDQTAIPICEARYDFLDACKPQGFFFLFSLAPKFQRMWNSKAAKLPHGITGLDTVSQMPVVPRIYALTVR
ncbi:hypothetical protein KM043_015944 [Ampulex compressa]|nr:hypothetical protein KM043_015944 [Ampulex compressa]